MKSTRFTLIPAVAMSLALAIPAPLMAQANALQVYSNRVLYTFTGQADGANPYAGVIADDAGNIYGTAAKGGDLACVEGYGYGCGVVFKIDSAGQYTVLHAFRGGTDGALIDGYSSEGVVRDNDGNLYGTAFYGGDPNCGCGVVYKIDPQGNYSVIHMFTGPDGYNPDQTLLLSRDGNLYGTTFQGGTNECGGYGCGVVFKMDLQGNETLLYSFRETGGDGNFPGSPGPLAQDHDGNLYGNTGGGGTFGQGVVFKIDPLSQDHRETVLYAFTGGTDGAIPGAVVLDDAGNVYGPTVFGGVNGVGVVFKLDPMRQLTVLHDFTGGADGGYPNPPIRDAQGNLYGTTGAASDPKAHYGGIFKIYPGGHLTVLYNFQNTDGAFPYAGVFRDRHGNLYGTTNIGGDLNACSFGPGCGVVFKLSACTTALCRGQ